jgi:hypothetical protein
MILRLGLSIQKLLVLLSYWVGPASARGGVTISWVVGPTETAGVVHAMADRLPHSYSVVLTASRFYSRSYDTAWRPTGRRRSALRRIFMGPILFGRLASRARGFAYVGARGFLLNEPTGRSFEFAFLKRHGLKVACYWCGSDIRSTRLMHELERDMGLPNISSYIEFVNPSLATESHERVVRARAKTADQFADVMFTFPTAQRSYLTKWAEPAFYFIEDAAFDGDDSKFGQLDTLVIAHSASSPIIKGTQLVRSAIERLRRLGYQFEYLELIDMPNEQVLAGLKRAHIALNHFYGFTAGMFALEAMAARCAVISSTDGAIETMLPPGANDAVMVTKHYQVYENLKLLLDEPERIAPLAQRGHDWALRYASATHAGHLLTSVLDSVLDGTYDATMRASLPVSSLWGGEGTD